MFERHTPARETRRLQPVGLVATSVYRLFATRSIVFLDVRHSRWCNLLWNSVLNALLIRSTKTSARAQLIYGMYQIPQQTSSHTAVERRKRSRLGKWSPLRAGGRQNLVPVSICSGVEICSVSTPEGDRYPRFQTARRLPLFFRGRAVELSSTHKNPHRTAPR